MAKSKSAKDPAISIKVKAGKPKSPKDGKKSAKPKVTIRKGGKGSKGYDAVLKLADHPLIADLLAVGAMAAVAAIAEGGKGQKLAGQSTKAVKNAGKAAAAAIGKRLLDEVGNFAKSKR